MSEIKYPTLKKFLIEAPLYEWDDLSSDKCKEAILSFNDAIDVYCPECEQHSIFNRDSNSRYELITYPQKRTNPCDIYFRCSRDEKHELHFMLWLGNSKLQKIGQYPSLADLSFYDVKKYSKVLESHYFTELKKAIGLATHGIGVGSFVYLRRIFEFLIEEAHQLAKSYSDWNEDLYLSKKRVDEKIGLLRTELPDFLVENTAIYSILSKGIHELTEQECLTAFPVMKLGIEMILDDKLAKREKAEKQAQAAKAIQELHSKHSTKAK